LKEAEPPVLERFLAKGGLNNCGQQGAERQRHMQPASDLFRGWQRMAEGYDARPPTTPGCASSADWELSANIGVMPKEVAGEYRPPVRSDLRPTPDRGMWWPSAPTWAEATFSTVPRQA
jgi:hypothetical protein